MINKIGFPMIFADYVIPFAYFIVLVILLRGTIVLTALIPIPLSVCPDREVLTIILRVKWMIAVEKFAAAIKLHAEARELRSLFRA